MADVAYSYRRDEQEELPIITLKIIVRDNGSITLTGSIPEKLRSNIHAAMKNSKHDYRLPGTGVLELHIKRTSDRTAEGILEVVKQCAERLAKRSDVEIRFEG